MRRAAGVPKLGEHVTALGVNRIRDAAPSRLLLFGVKTRCVIVAARGRRDRCRFGDDKPAVGCALAVIFEHQVTRNAASRAGRAAGSWPA